MVRKEMLISPPHLLRLMTHPYVDQPLVDALGSTIAGEGMLEDVPAGQLRPLAALEDAQEVLARAILPYVWGEAAGAGWSCAQKPLFFQAVRLGCGLAGPKSVVTTLHGNFQLNPAKSP